MVVMNTQFHNLGSHKGPEDTEVPEGPGWQKVQEVREILNLMEFFNLMLFPYYPGFTGGSEPLEGPGCLRGLRGQEVLGNLSVQRRPRSLG